MNLKRHHVLYVLLAVCLIVAIVVFLLPSPPQMSYTAPIATTSLPSKVMKSATTSSSLPKGETSTRAIAPLRFEVVTSQATQERGLGGRSTIPENYAMLFVFPQDTRVGFWMKDMLAPIDMVWVSDKGTILGIEDSVAPDTYPKAFYPPQPVKYVLETKAGESRRRGWHVGTNVELPLPYRS